MNSDTGEHDLGECEDEWGYMCEECRQEYLERMDDFALSKDDVGWEMEYSAG